MEATGNVTGGARGPARQTVKAPGPISCITDERTLRVGRLIARHWFAVPAENYIDGCLTGQRVAAEFMAAIRAGTVFDPLQVICAACQTFEERRAVNEASAAGAAVGFLRTLEGLLVMVAACGAHEHYIQERINFALEWQREAAQQAKDKKLNFARRMEIAKAAKALARRVIEQAAKTVCRA